MLWKCWKTPRKLYICELVKFIKISVFRQLKPNSIFGKEKLKFNLHSTRTRKERSWFLKRFHQTTTALFLCHFLLKINITLMIVEFPIKKAPHYTIRSNSFISGYIADETSVNLTIKSGYITIKSGCIICWLIWNIKVFVGVYWKYFKWHFQTISTA